MCGSKYNDDPFGQQESKPDAWAAMKRRIQALIDADENQKAGNSSVPLPSGMKQHR